MKTPAPVYLLEYTDLCEHTDSSTEGFFNEDGLCNIMTVGFVKEVIVNGIPCLKVLHYHDQDSTKNSGGIVIQKSVVKTMKRLK